ncbi:integumentary mucin A.1-like [Ptychodera flava]|uniref:integumentary mucin A.1-like n=1 Tax=Ptychodera flava TaxID=63121 RepID=UPI00396A9833
MSVIKADQITKANSLNIGGPPVSAALKTEVLNILRRSIGGPAPFTCWGLTVTATSDHFSSNKEIRLAPSTQSLQSVDFAVPFMTLTEYSVDGENNIPSFTTTFSLLTLGFNTTTTTTPTTTSTTTTTTVNITTTTTTTTTTPPPPPPTTTTTTLPPPTLPPTPTTPLLPPPLPPTTTTLPPPPPP